MIEVLGLIFTFLAALWARKQDIASYINDPESRSKIVSAILVPETRFRRLSKQLASFLDRVLERGTRFFFAVFMLSLLYVSLSFVLSLSLSDSKELLFGQEYSVDSARIAFLLFLISTPLVLISGRTHNRHLSSHLVNPDNQASANRKLSLIRSRNSAKVYFVFCALMLTISAHVVYQSEILTAFTAVSSLVPAVRAQYLKPFFLIRDNPLAAAIGANLGTLGLLLAAYSFASSTMTHVDYAFIVFLSLLSGLLAALSLTNCQVQADPEYRDFWRFRPTDGIIAALLSAIGRPSLFVGFHCVRAPGPFALAVTIILINVVLARTLVPQPVVSAGTIMLACIVFFSGATTLAGAGIFSFGAVMLIGAYMSFDPENLFSLWAAPFLLWILLPVTNSFIDMARWTLARRNLETYALGRGFGGARLIYFDALLGILGFFIYVFLTFFILSAFEVIGSGLGYFVSFKVGDIVQALKDDLFQNGIWLLFISGTMMLPTIVQFALFLYSGLIFLVPKHHLREVAAKVMSAETSYEKDILAWQIAALDVMGRLVFSGLVLVGTGGLLWAVLPLGEWLTVQALDFGYHYGSSIANWVFATL